MSLRTRLWIPTAKKHHVDAEINPIIQIFSQYRSQLEA